MAAAALLAPVVLLALLRALLCPCPCRGAPASPPAVTARLAAKWPLTPLLLEARCVQPLRCLPLLPGVGTGTGTGAALAAGREAGGAGAAWGKSSFISRQLTRCCLTSEVTVGKGLTKGVGLR